MHNKVVICLDNKFNSSELTEGRVYETLLNDEQLKKGFVYVINDNLEIKKYKLSRFKFLNDYYNNMKLKETCCSVCGSSNIDVKVSYEKYIKMFIKCNRCGNDKTFDDKISNFNEYLKNEYINVSNRENKKLANKRLEKCCLCENKFTEIRERSYKDSLNIYHIHCDKCDYNFVNNSLSNLNFSIRKSVDYENE